MKNYLYKEFKLGLSPINWTFLIMPCMLLIPSYPCYVPFYYICLSIMFIFNNGEINKDMQYSFILPVKKSDIVKARCLLVAVYELITIALGIIFAFINIKISPTSTNPAGIACNVAFFGLLLIVFSGFNFFFFKSFYKKGEKPGFPFLLGSIAFWILYGIFEFPIWTSNITNIEYFNVLDKVDGASMIKQLPILAAGIVIYVLGWIVTYKVSAKKFEKVNL